MEWVCKWKWMMKMNLFFRCFETDFQGRRISVHPALEKRGLGRSPLPAGRGRKPLTMKGWSAMTPENDKTPEFEKTIVGGLFAIAEGLHAVADAIEAQSFSPEHEQIEQAVASLFKIAENVNP